MFAQFIVFSVQVIGIADQLVRGRYCIGILFAVDAVLYQQI